MLVPQAYTNLRNFKQIGLWVLPALSSLLLSCDQSQSSSTTPPIDKPSFNPPTAPAGPLTVQSTIIKRERDDSFLAEINFTFDNQSTETVSASESAKLITETGRTLPVFFLAFAGTPPDLPTGKTSTATTRFSLRAEDIVGSLTLQLGEHTAEVKSSRSFDPDSITAPNSKTFTQLDW